MSVIESDLTRQLRFIRAVRRPESAGLPRFPGVPRSPLIGRERERTVLERLLLSPDVGLITVSGPIGVGKTRLALQVVSELRDHFYDGVTVLNVDSGHDHESLLRLLADSFQIDVVDTALESVADAIRGETRLVVLDGCERSIAAVSTVVRLVEYCPNLKVLAISRDAIRIRDEREVPVLPLASPPIPASLDAIRTSPAIALFLDRATAIQPDLVVSPQALATIEAICRRLDGVP